MFCGILDFRRADQACREAAEKLMQRACRYSHQRSEKLQQSAGFVLYSVLPINAREGTTLAMQDTAGRPCWFYGLTGSHLNSIPSTLTTFQQYCWESPLEQDGQWVALRWDEQSRKLRIATDFLGSVWLYVARIESGYLFSHDFAALSGHPAVEPTLDEENLLVELGLGYQPDNETIYRDIFILPPGTVVDLAPDGVRVVSRSVPDYGDRFSTFSQTDKFEYLDSLYQPIYESAIANDLEETCLSLSAGLDSRYALAMLHAHSHHCHAFTFGVHNSDEVFNAGKMAELAGIESTCFNFEHSSWSGWRRCIGQLGGIGMVQWVGWAEQWLRLLANDHRYVLIGYLGDALTGKHLVRRDPSQDWRKAWLDWSIDDWASSEMLQPEYRGRAIELADAKLETLTSDIDTAYPHQVAMHLDLYGRQRRWVASQPNLIARFMHPKPYFLNQQLVHFWSNLAFQDLDRQHLYKAYAQSRFPLFFSDVSNAPSLFSRLRNKIVREANKLAGRQPRERVSHVIDRFKIIQQNQKEIYELTRRTEAELGHIIDYGKFRHVLETMNSAGKASQATTGLILRGVNLMILVDRH